MVVPALSESLERFFGPPRQCDGGDGQGDLPSQHGLSTLHFHCLLSSTSTWSLAWSAVEKRSSKLHTNAIRIIGSVTPLCSNTPVICRFNSCQPQTDLGSRSRATKEINKAHLFKQHSTPDNFLDHGAALTATSNHLHKPGLFSVPREASSIELSTSEIPHRVRMAEWDSVEVHASKHRPSLEGKGRV